MLIQPRSLSVLCVQGVWHKPKPKKRVPAYEMAPAWTRFVQQERDLLACEQQAFEAFRALPPSFHLISAPRDGRASLKPKLRKAATPNLYRRYQPPDAQTGKAAVAATASTSGQPPPRSASMPTLGGGGGGGGGGATEGIANPTSSWAAAEAERKRARLHAAIEGEHIAAVVPVLTALRQGLASGIAAKRAASEASLLKPRRMAPQLAMPAVAGAPASDDGPIGEAACDRLARTHTISSIGKVGVETTASSASVRSVGHSNSSSSSSFGGGKHVHRPAPGIAWRAAPQLSTPAGESFNEESAEAEGLASPTEILPLDPPPATRPSAMAGATQPATARGVSIVHEPVPIKAKRVPVHERLSAPSHAKQTYGTTGRSRFLTMRA